MLSAARRPPHRMRMRTKAAQPCSVRQLHSLPHQQPMAHQAPGSCRVTCGWSRSGQVRPCKQPQWREVCNRKKHRGIVRRCLLDVIYHVASLQSTSAAAMKGAGRHLRNSDAMVANMCCRSGRHSRRWRLCPDAAAGAPWHGWRCSVSTSSGSRSQR